MKQFCDKTGAAWRIDLTFGAVLRVRQRDGQLDLLDPTLQIDGQPLQVALSLDLVRFWGLLWLLVEPQAIAMGVTAEQFGELMAADCLVTAQAAFFDEWRDFFRSLRRPDAALAVETQARTQETALKLVAAKIKTVNQTELLTTIESRLETEVSGQFGKLRDSLAAIRADSLGDSST